MGWKYQDVVKTLEDKRKAKSALYYETRKKLQVSCITFQRKYTFSITFFKFEYETHKHFGSQFPTFCMSSNYRFCNNKVS